MPRKAILSVHIWSRLNTVKYHAYCILEQKERFLHVAQRPVGWRDVEPEPVT